MAGRLASKEDRRIKLFLIYKVLKAMQKNADLFERGIYMRLGVRAQLRRISLLLPKNMKAGGHRSQAYHRLITKDGTLQENFFDWQLPGDARLVLPKKSPSSWINAIGGQSEVRKRCHRIRLLSISPLPFSWAGRKNEG